MTVVPAYAMTIRRLLARGVDLPLPRPIETAGGTMRSAPLVLIDLHTNEGIVGKSYVRCYTATALEPLAKLINNVGTLLEGKPAAPAVIEHVVARHFHLLGPEGLTGMSMAGIDIALWDVLAKAAGMPLARLLGGETRPIQAYASLRSMSALQAAAEAQELLTAGFTALKLKVGGADLAADIEAIRAVRGVTGASVKLMVDYNQSLSVTEAIDRCRVLDGEGLNWIEEPTRADDFEGHARIAATTTTAIQLGENWRGIHDMAKSLAVHASDHAMLDVVKIGGVSGWMRAAGLAEAAGLPVSSHTYPELSVHLLNVTPTALWLEYLDHVRSILLEPVQTEGALVAVSDRPGVGLEWDEDAIRAVRAR